MSRTIIILLTLVGLLMVFQAGAEAIGMQYLHNVEKLPEGRYKTTGSDAFLQFDFTDSPVTLEKSYLLMEIKTSQAADFAITWQRLSELPINMKRLPLPTVPAEKYVTRVVDLAVLGTYRPKDVLLLNVNGTPGVTFDVRNIKLVSFDQVPRDLLPGLIDFHCFTSKLHYLPGERIEYKATMAARNYPDRESAKVLTVKLLDEKGVCVAEHVQHYGIQPMHWIKELFGVLEPKEPLQPGKYHLEASSVDMRTGMTLTASHQFGVQGENDPFVCETPFKFVKDFSVIKGKDGLWHVFSITGDFVGTHEWFEDGQERTFSHSTSPDLRHWTYHPPVLSINDDNYPDGNGKVADRNIWAPHVILHEDMYYMFYTSVNGHGGESISLATSPDLFSWTNYEKNPVFTLEGVDWALWGRDLFVAGRDPLVLEDNGKFYIYVTAVAKEGDKRGVVAVAESEDLVHWKNAQIAVRGNIDCESPQVWKSNDTYYMTTSSYGAGTFTSKNPVHGWQETPFPRPPISESEKYITTGESYAEEVTRMDDGSLLMAALTFRPWGNSIYFYKIITDADGRPIGYESPFKD